MLETLVRTHQAELYRYARYLGAERATAEDLVQETFLAAFRAEDPEHAAAPWLRGILRNQFLNWCRRRRLAPQSADPAALSQAESVWQDVFLRDGDGFDYLQALRKCLADQPEKHRQALDLQYAQKKSRAEIARLLSLTEDGVKSFMRRIRARLAECVGKRLAAEGG